MDQLRSEYIFVEILESREGKGHKEIPDLKNGFLRSGIEYTIKTV